MIYLCAAKATIDQGLKSHQYWILSRGLHEIRITLKSPGVCNLRWTSILSEVEKCIKIIRRINRTQSSVFWRIAELIRTLHQSIKFIAPKRYRYSIFSANKNKQGCKINWYMIYNVGHPLNIIDHRHNCWFIIII